MASHFSISSNRKVTKRVPPRQPSFILYIKNKVPSSVAIFVAAAELANYKANSLKHPRRKPPQKSPPHQLG